MKINLKKISKFIFYFRTCCFHYLIWTFILLWNIGHPKKKPPTNSVLATLFTYNPFTYPPKPPHPLSLSHPRERIHDCVIRHFKLQVPRHYFSASPPHGFVPGLSTLSTLYLPPITTLFTYHPLLLSLEKK